MPEHYTSLTPERRELLISLATSEEAKERRRKIRIEQSPYIRQILEAEQITGEDLNVRITPSYLIDLIL